MSTIAKKPDHRTLPRRKRPPSSRDQAIYLARHALGWSQAQLAQQFQLSQPRVSQILRRVEQWRARTGSPVERELDAAGRRALERQLERERSLALYDRAIRAFDAAPRELTAHKRGERDGKTFSEDSQRDLPPHVQMLKIAMRVNEMLFRLQAADSNSFGSFNSSPDESSQVTGAGDFAAESAA